MEEKIKKLGLGMLIINICTFAILVYSFTGLRDVYNDEGINGLCQKYYCEEPASDLQKIIDIKYDKILDILDEVYYKNQDPIIKEKLCSILEYSFTYESAKEFCEILPFLEKEYFE